MPGWAPHAFQARPARSSGSSSIYGSGWRESHPPPPAPKAGVSLRDYTPKQARFANRRPIAERTAEDLHPNPVRGLTH